MAAVFLPAPQQSAVLLQNNIPPPNPILITDVGNPQHLTAALDIAIDYNINVQEAAQPRVTGARATIRDVVEADTYLRGVQLALMVPSLAFAIPNQLANVINNNHNQVLGLINNQQNFITNLQAAAAILHTSNANLNAAVGYSSAHYDCRLTDKDYELADHGHGSAYHGHRFADYRQCPARCTGYSPARSSSSGMSDI